MVGGLGNGHSIYRPFLNKEVRSTDGLVLEQTRPSVLHDVKLDSTTIGILHIAMAEVIKPGGTAGRAAVQGIEVGGKTGSAQNPHGELTHGLFIGCAPVDEPVIAICVVVENAGHGGSVGAPIAGAVLRSFFAVTDEGIATVQKYAEKTKSLQAAKKNPD
jgi:penicillin-binding protein 2